LYDLQGRFNLNNVADKKYQISFQEFLKNTLKKIDQQKKNALSLALFNWLNPYQPGQEAVDNLDYYFKQKPPYFPAHQFMVNPSEFRLLRDVDAKLYKNIADYIIALPEQTAININTASAPVLMSLGFGLNTQQIQELIGSRGKEGIRDLSKINPILQKLNIRPEQVTIESEYYMSIASVSSEDLSLVSYVILKRNKSKNGKITVSLVSESLNSF
jgi:general secretion pathway protein K